MNRTRRTFTPEVDATPRRRERCEGRGPSETAIQAVRESAATDPEVGGPRRRDLSKIVGSWVADPAVDEVLNEPRKRDPER